MQPTFGNGRSFLVVSHSPYRDMHMYMHKVFFSYNLHKKKTNGLKKRRT